MSAPTHQDRRTAHASSSAVFRFLLLLVLVLWLVGPELECVEEHAHAARGVVWLPVSFAMGADTSLEYAITFEAVASDGSSSGSGFGTAQYVIHQPIRTSSSSASATTRVSIKCAPAVPYGATVLAWQWMLDENITGTLPAWVQYVAPFDGSDFAKLTFPDTNLTASSLLLPATLQFKGVVSFTRAYRLARGSVSQPDPPTEQRLQAARVLVQPVAYASDEARLTPYKQLYSIDQQSDGTLLWKNLANSANASKPTALGELTLESGDVLQLDCPSGCVLCPDATSQCVFAAGSQVHVRSGVLRFDAQALALGSVRVDSGAVLAFASNDTSILGSPTHVPIQNDGVIYVLAGALRVDTAMTGTGALHVVYGAVCVMAGPDLTVFNTSSSLNGGEVTNEGIMAMASGVVRFATPYRGDGPMLVGEPSVVEFDSAAAPSSTTTTVTVEHAIGRQPLSANLTAPLTASTSTGWLSAALPLALEVRGLVNVLGGRIWLQRPVRVADGGRLHVVAGELMVAEEPPTTSSASPPTTPLAGVRMLLAATADPLEVYSGARVAFVSGAARLEAQLRSDGALYVVQPASLALAAAAQLTGSGLQATGGLTVSAPLRVAAALVSAGSVRVASGGVLQVDGSPQYIMMQLSGTAAQLNLENDAQLQVLSGAALFAAPIHSPSTTSWLVGDSGVLAIDSSHADSVMEGSFAVSGVLHLASGELDVKGPLTISRGGRVAIASAGRLVLAGAQADLGGSGGIENNGSLILQDVNARLSHGALVNRGSQFSSTATATLTVAASDEETVLQPSLAGLPLSASIQGRFVIAPDGRVRVAAQTDVMLSRVEHHGKLTLDEGAQLDSDSFDQSGAAAAPSQTVLANGAVIRVTSGRCDLRDTVVQSDHGVLYCSLNATRTQLAVTGQLMVNGDATISDSSLMNVRVCGATAVSDYDQLRVGGKASIKAQLNVAMCPTLSAVTDARSMDVDVITSAGTAECDLALTGLDADSGWQAETRVLATGIQLHCNHRSHDGKLPNGAPASYLSTSALAAPLYMCVFTTIALALQLRARAVLDVDG